MRIKIAVVTLILTSLACMQPVVTLTPTAQAEINVTTQSPTVTAVPSPTHAASETAASTPQPATVSTAVVRVHTDPDVLSNTVGWLNIGDPVNILSCTDNFCKIEKPAGWVWRGCISDNPDGLGCEAR